MGAYVGLGWPILEHLGVMLGSSWLQLGHLGALLGHLRLSWSPSWLILGAAGRHEPCKNCRENDDLRHNAKNQQN